MDDYCPHVADEETKAHRGVLACLGAQLGGGSLDLAPGQRLYKAGTGQPVEGCVPPAAQEQGGGDTQQTPNGGQRMG